MPRKGSKVTLYLNEADIKADLERFRLVTAGETGYAFATEIRKMYWKAMAMYYADYEPQFYQRTFQLGGKTAIKKHVEAINKNTFFAGVIPTPALLNHKHWNGMDLSSSEEAALFHYSYYEGSHGTVNENDYYSGKRNHMFTRPGNNGIIPSDETNRMIKAAIKKKRFINAAMKQGVNKAKQKHYKYLQFYSR